MFTLNGELNYQTQIKWGWQDKTHRIQISNSNKLERIILRKVYVSEAYAVYAYINEDYIIEVSAYFNTTCDPNSVIITSQRYGSGAPKKLICIPTGDALRFDARWPHNIAAKKHWKENLDGFDVDVNFSEWDFAPLLKELTLTKAMKKASLKINNLDSK